MRWRWGVQIAVPIKRFPCCNQCTEALGPYLLPHQSGVNGNTQTSKHISAYSANIVRETPKQRDTRIQERTNALENTHTAGRGNQPSRPTAEHTLFGTSQSQGAAFNSLIPVLSDFSCCQSSLLFFVHIPSPNQYSFFLNDSLT